MRARGAAGKGAVPCVDKAEARLLASLQPILEKLAGRRVARVQLLLRMHRLKNWGRGAAARAALVVAATLLLSGCGLFKTKTRIAVPQPLTPVVDADMPQMFAEVNRLGAVRSLNGRVDIQF